MLHNNNGQVVHTLMAYITRQYNLTPV